MIADDEFVIIPERPLGGLFSHLSLSHLSFFWKERNIFSQSRSLPEKNYKKQKSFFFLREIYILATDDLQAIVIGLNEMTIVFPQIERKKDDKRKNKRRKWNHDDDDDPNCRRIDPDEQPNICLFLSSQLTPMYHILKSVEWIDTKSCVIVSSGSFQLWAPFSSLCTIHWEWYKR